MVQLTEQIIRGKTRLDKLEEVKNLNLWGQDLDDVSVLAKLPNVEVLSLSVNRISSLRDFRHCSMLKELYLRKNYVTDITELMYLQPLKDLRVLWLCDNPCAEHPFYRQLVARLLPSVDKLDNMEVTPQDKDAARRNPELQKYVVASSAGSESKSAGGLLPALDARGLGGGAPQRLTPQPGYSSAQGYGHAAERASPSMYASPNPLSPLSPSRASSHAHEGNGYGGRGTGGGGDRDQNGGRRRKNVLYAVMALVSELDEDDLVYVKREIEQRLGALGR